MNRSLNGEKFFIQALFFLLINNVYIVSEVKENEIDSDEFIVYNNENNNFRNDRRYVIGAWPGGMGSCFFAMLLHFRVCEHHNFIPIAYWGKESLYYCENGFNGSTNVWEYYFEPISDLIYKPGDRINITDCLGNPNSCGSFYFNPWNLHQQMRNDAYNLLTKYNVKPNKIVQTKIDNFYRQNIEGKHTIAIHIRGTDKFHEEKPVSPRAIVNEALKHANEHTQFFIATDEQRILNELLALLAGKKVIYYDCYRSPNNKPLHVKDRRPSFAQVGEDVIVEIYLLSMCNRLIHTISNVSILALFLNPKISNNVLRA